MVRTRRMTKIATHKSRIFLAKRQCLVMCRAVNDELERYERALETRPDIACLVKIRLDTMTAVRDIYLDIFRNSIIRYVHLSNGKYE